jgi:hypothetical protein
MSSGRLPSGCGGARRAIAEGTVSAQLTCDSTDTFQRTYVTSFAYRQAHRRPVSFALRQALGGPGLALDCAGQPSPLHPEEGMVASSDTSGGQAPDRSTNDPEGLVGRYRRWRRQPGDTGTATWAGPAAAPAWGRPWQHGGSRRVRRPRRRRRCRDGGRRPDRHPRPPQLVDLATFATNPRGRRKGTNPTDRAF